MAFWAFRCVYLFLETSPTKPGPASWELILAERKKAPIRWRPIVLSWFVLHKNFGFFDS